MRLANEDLLLNLDGVPTHSPRGDGQPFFAYDQLGVWRASTGDGEQDVEDVCIPLYDDLKRVIMRGVDYETLVYLVPQFVMDAGHNAEAPISRDMFEKCLKASAGFPEINRFLYLYDCERLISSVQSCVHEIIQVQGEFYRTLNLEPLSFAPPDNQDTVRWSSSPAVAALYAYISFIFIRLHSLLDYSVKLVMEAEHLRTDFATYPRMSSANLQYGDRKRVSFNGAVDTLFEDCPFLVGIESLRNHIIHDALLDDHPKVYERIVRGKTTEKFILMPDMTEGRFDRFKNRNLFFGGEDKINLRLPALISEFMRRQRMTLQRVRSVFATE